MKIAKLFQHGGSQAVRLPKEFRFEGKEVLISKRGDEVILRPKAIRTVGEHLDQFFARYPQGVSIHRHQPRAQQKRALSWC